MIFKGQISYFDNNPTPLSLEGCLKKCDHLSYIQSGYFKHHIFFMKDVVRKPILFNI